MRLAKEIFIFRLLLVTIVFFLFAFNSCRTSRKTNQKDRLTENFELYLKETSSGDYAEYSRKLGYYLSGKEDKSLLAEIIGWLGTPYKHGGNTKSGADCSGFVKEVFKAVYNIDLYRSTSDQVKNGQRINNKQSLKEADLVFFRISGRNISHVGIYISNNYFAHASSSRGVVVDNLDQKYYADRFAFGGRVLR
ncbi:MAG: C40 family peptidase [Bacteroidetes bacterium]|nr:C40 family peptidase [Bacteroidota bacterium]